MIVMVTFSTKMSIFCNTIVFSRFWRNFGAILAHRRFRLLFFVIINNIVNNVSGQYLIIFKDDILMLIDIRIFLLIIQINGLKSFGTEDTLIHKFLVGVAIRFAHTDLVHDAAHLFLRFFNLIVANVKDHTEFGNLVAFLTNFNKFVVLIKFLSR
jgi:hypothetical protein